VWRSVVGGRRAVFSAPRKGRTDMETGKAERVGQDRYAHMHICMLIVVGNIPW
jgi:hypothetical protein